VLQEPKYRQTEPVSVFVNRYKLITKENIKERRGRDGQSLGLLFSYVDDPVRDDGWILQEALG